MISEREKNIRKQEREALKEYMKSLETKMAYNEYNKVDNEKLKNHRKKMRRILV